MMDDGRVDHRRVRHHGCHGHHAGMGDSLRGDEGGEHEQLRRIRVHGLAWLVALDGAAGGCHSTVNLVSCRRL